MERAQNTGCNVQFRCNVQFQRLAEEPSSFIESSVAGTVGTSVETSHGVSARMPHHSAPILQPSRDRRAGRGAILGKNDSIDLPILQGISRFRFQATLYRYC